ncbi:protein hook [Podospora conica]|nr:protein hook [Schizothecium conicum]
MAQFSHSTQAALLRWINTFDTRRKASTLADLQDGILLGQALEQMLSPEFQSSSLIQHPSTSDENRQNLEMVYRGLASFLRSDNPVLAPSPSEFRAIAENPDDDAMCDFLSAFLAAACLGSLSRTYVPRVMTLDKATQAEIAKIINHQTQLKNEREAADDFESQSEMEDMDVYAQRDPVLLGEELDHLRDKYDILWKQNADLQSRIDKLLDTREAVLADLREAQDELSAQKRSRGNDASAAIKGLQNEMREKVSEIDRLEDLLDKESKKATRFEKENETLRVKTERLKQLEDSLTVLEHESRQYQQTIKGLENYKKKAQDLTVIQQRNRVLEDQIAQLEQDLRELEDVKLLNKKLQKEIEEKANVLANNEQEIIFTIQSKGVLQEVNEDLRRRVEYLESRRQLDEGTIKELEEQLQLADVPLPSDSSPRNSTANFNLEHELETTSDPTLALRVEISRLRAENTVLKTNLGVSSDNEKLREELEAATGKADVYRIQSIEALEKQAVAQEQLNAVVNKMTGEEDKAFIAMREALLNAQRELDLARARVQELERLAADKDRELLRTKTDISALGQEQAAALGAIKATDELLSESLTTELAATRRQLHQKTLEVNAIKDQLMVTLLSKDKIRKDLDEAVAATMGQVVSGEPAKGKKDDADKAEKIEKLREALRKRVEQLDKSEQEKYELQRRVKAAESGGASTALKAEYEKKVKTLERENALITTAWYDITSRLQSNHVVLQRRQDAPRSWLNKQRQMVNATPRR